MPRSVKSSLSTLFVGLSVLAIGVAGHHFASKAIYEALESSVLLASEAANEDLTQLFVNDVYDALDSMLQLNADLGQQTDSLSDEDYNAINQRISEFMLGTDFLKIKIYNLKGVTLYSSDPRQLGSDYSQNSGFINASRGESFSSVELRSEFNGYSGVVYNRDVVSSYVPIRRGITGGSVDGRIIGVAEVYTDRTNQMEAVRDKAAEYSFALVIVLLLMSVVMVATVWYLSISISERYIDELEAPE